MGGGLIQPPTQTAATSTLASLKQAPPPTELTSSGTRVVEVKPFFELLRQAPLGIKTTPGARLLVDTFEFPY